VINDTGQKTKFNGYLKDDNGFNGPVLFIVSAVICAEVNGEEL